MAGTAPQRSPAALHTYKTPLAWGAALVCSPDTGSHLTKSRAMVTGIAGTRHPQPWWSARTRLVTQCSLPLPPYMESGAAGSDSRRKHSQPFPFSRGLWRYRLLQRALRPLWTCLRLTNLWQLWCAAGRPATKQNSAQSGADDWPHKDLPHSGASDSVCTRLPAQVCLPKWGCHSRLSRPGGATTLLLCHGGARVAERALYRRSCTDAMGLQRDERAGGHVLEANSPSYV
jgi:hypothetical protein